MHLHVYTSLLTSTAQGDADVQMPESFGRDAISGDSPTSSKHQQRTRAESYDDLHTLCASIAARVTTFLEAEVPTPTLKGVQAQARISLEVIQEALDRYSLAELSLSYNGGKDCLVLLILYIAAIFRKGSLHQTKRLQSVYIVSEHPFPEVDAFVEETTQAYYLDLVRYAKPMKLAFEDYLNERSQVKAIFVGTRRTDPHGADLTHFDRTDHGWPDFMRIHPVIDWHYAEIWAFLRHLEIPYCPLYNQGYTSLGGTVDTHPNPALRTADGSYKPAYELYLDEAERLGRDN